MTRPIDVVVTGEGGQVRIPLERLSTAAQAAIKRMTGGAGLVDGGRFVDAVDSNSREIDVSPAVALELGRAVAQDGFLRGLHVEPRPLPAKPHRNEFDDEVEYFKAAAKHADLAASWEDQL